MIYSGKELAAASGRSLRTIRLHVKNGWLKQEPKQPGVKGSRFGSANARKWLERHFPEKRNALPKQF